MPRTLGRSSVEVAVDPFGPQDPVEVARLVRRALAAGGRKAFEVVALIIVTDRDVDPCALSRFCRRALGPHGEGLVPVGLRSDATTHEVRCAEALDTVGRLVEGRLGRPSAASLVIAVALGPGPSATALCVE